MEPQPSGSMALSNSLKYRFSHFWVDVGTETYWAAYVRRYLQRAFWHVKVLLYSEQTLICMVIDNNDVFRTVM